LCGFLWIAAGLVVGESSTEAYELNGGVSLGGILVGTVPRLADRRGSCDSMGVEMNSRTLIAMAALLTVVACNYTDGVREDRGRRATKGVSGQGARELQGL